MALLGTRVGAPRRLGGVAVLALFAGCVPPRAPVVDAPQAPTRDPHTLDQAALDALIETTWRDARVVVAPPADDLEFLRRVSLDLWGRPPRLDEIAVFRADNRPDQRARLVDGLLAGPAFADHWATLTETAFLGRDARPRLEKVADAHGYFTDAFAKNRPYDAIATDILGGNGSLRRNGALAFIAEKTRNGGPEAAAGATARLFLGLQIQCAQCHDHPYDPRWKQEDFYGLVGFFTRTRVRADKTQGKQDAKGDRDFDVFEVDTGEAIMRKPRATADEVVFPRFLGRPLPLSDDKPRRQELARAVTTSDLFAKATVGRTWAWLFGRGIADPWDDLGAEKDPKHPALLVRLADDFVASGYDTKRLVRLLVLSTAYARAARPAADATADNGAAVRAFAQVGVRPLPPQDLVNTLVTATGVNEVVRQRKGAAEWEHKLEQALRQYTFVFGDDEMAEVDTFDGNLPQALILWNGELSNGGARAAPGGVLDKILDGTPDPDRRIDEIMLAAYTRVPNNDERRELRGFVDRQGGSRRAYEDLFFSLLVSTESVTRH